MRARVSEATRATAATPIDGKPGRFLIQLITPGWGSSGYYSEAVLKQAATDKVWPKGTQMFVDHPGVNEEYDRPERTIRDLASVLDEDARWDADLGALVAEANVFSAFRPMLAPRAEGGIADDIGVSIRAWCESEPGEAEGRKGQLVKSLVEGISVDYVTRAGRGGKILEVIESARRRVDPNPQSVEVEEASANDTRQLLDRAVTAAYGDDDVWVYVIDWDADKGVVWFAQSTPDSRTTYAQSYTLDGSTVTLDGDPTEVRPVTTYVPVGESGDPTEEVGIMPNIEESELARLRESDRRMTEAERDRDAAVTRAEAAETERDRLAEADARRERGNTVARIFRESLGHESREGLEPDDYQRRGIMADAVVRDGQVDEAATRAAFDKALDKLLEGSKPKGGGVRLGRTSASEAQAAGGDEPEGSFEFLDDLSEAAFDLDAPASTMVKG